jgi:hypothetical protein
MYANRSCQFQRIPENDSCNDQIESLRTSLLLGMKTILNPSMPIEKHRTGQGIARLPFIQSDLDTLMQFDALQPFQGKECFSNHPTSRNAQARPFWRG